MVYVKLIAPTTKSRLKYKIFKIHFNYNNKPFYPSITCMNHASFE